jgi:MFS family permease
VVAAGVIAIWATLYRASRRRRISRADAAIGAALALSAAAAIVIARMPPPGAAVIGWSLVWAIPLAPGRALGHAGPDVAFGIGLALSAAANAGAVVATGLAGRAATGRRSVGLLAAALFALWPLLVGVIAGHRGWRNATWEIDAGLHMYTEPLSTALVAAALALLLVEPRSQFRHALAGLTLGFATAVKLSNGVLALLLLPLVVLRTGRQAAARYAAGLLAFAPIVFVYWPKGYENLNKNPRYWPDTVFSLHYAARSWRDTFLWTPRTLLVLVPLAMVGTLFVQRRHRVLLWAFVLVNPAFYTFFWFTPEHPRFLFASLPALFVLDAVAATGLVRLLTRRTDRITPTRAEVSIIADD